MKLSNNETQFFNTWTLGDGDRDLKQSLLYLNQKMNEITRQVSFWDVYNVTQVLLSDNDLISKLALLNIGEAAIVNTNVITNGTTPHYRGDIAYRKVDGEILWIPAENKGIYKPNISYDSTNDALQITYSYQSRTPQEGESESFAIADSTQDAYLINVAVTDTSSSVRFENGVCTFAEKQIGSDFLKPIVKFYIQEGNGFEEFYTDYYWTRNSTTRQISVTIDFYNHSIAQKVVMRVR